MAHHELVVFASRGGEICLRIDDDGIRRHLMIPEQSCYSLRWVAAAQKPQSSRLDVAIRRSTGT